MNRRVTSEAEGDKGDKGQRGHKRLRAGSAEGSNPATAGGPRVPRHMPHKRHVGIEYKP
ncbi:hypothetical protein ACFL6Y_11575 [Elusimicrobiota bacterium]